MTPAPTYTPYHQIAIHGEQTFIMYRPDETTMKMERATTTKLSRRELELMLREILDDKSLKLRTHTLDAINSRLRAAYEVGAIDT